MRGFLFLGALLALLALLAAGAVRVSRTPADGLVARLVSSAAGTESPARSEAAPELESAASEGVREAPQRAGSPLLEAGTRSVLEPTESGSSMVRYTDDAGSIHLVKSRSMVPARYRDRVVALGRGAVINQVEIPTRNTTAFLDYLPEATRHRANVTLYSAEWCGACKRAKKYLAGEGVRYDEIDIDRDAAARDELRRIVGRVAIPLLDADGQYVSGFKRSVYARVLGLDG